jgi:hypothetical protein
MTEALNNVKEVNFILLCSPPFYSTLLCSSCVITISINSIIHNCHESYRFFYEILDSDPGSAPHCQYEAGCLSVRNSLSFLFFSFLY